MSPQPGDVWLADLGIAAKTRPVVIVSRQDPNPPRALALYVPLTTQNRLSPYEVTLPRFPFLDRDSVGNVQGLASIPIVRLGAFFCALPDSVAPGQALQRLRAARGAAGIEEVGPDGIPRGGWQPPPFQRGTSQFAGAGRGRLNHRGLSRGRRHHVPAVHLDVRCRSVEHLPRVRRVEPARFTGHQLEIVVVPVDRRDVGAAFAFQG